MANELIYFEKKEAIFASTRKQNTVVNYGIILDGKLAPPEADSRKMYSLVRVDIIKRYLGNVDIKVNDKLKFYHVTGLVPAARCYNACDEVGSPIVQQFVQNEAMTWNYGDSTLPCAAIEMDEDAIRATNSIASASPGLYFALGPPGTGKSQWIANSLTLHVPHNKATVMVCTPSNISLIALAERVHELRPKFPNDVHIVCLGRRSKSKAKLKGQAECEFYAYEYCDALREPYDKMLANLETREDFDIPDKTTVLGRKLARTVEDLKHLVNAECDKNVSASTLQDIEKLITTLEEKFAESQPKDRDAFIKRLREVQECIANGETLFHVLLVERANIIFCTLVASGSKKLAKCLGAVDMLIVDESGQATVPETLIPLKYCTSNAVVIHIGDPQQLGPMVYTQPSSTKTGYELSLMDIMETRNPVRMDKARAWCHIFCTQYRMLPELYDWPNMRYYFGIVKSAPHMKDILKNSRCKDLPPNQFYNIKGQEEKVGTSYRNIAEADAIVAKIKETLKPLVDEQNICVITFYAAQVAYITKQLQEHNIRGVDVGTVDGYQGGQRDVVLLSVVRTRKEAGFLKESRRINVSMTRPRLLRWVFGDCDNLKTSQTDLGAFLAYNTSGENFAEYQPYYPPGNQGGYPSGGRGRFNHQQQPFNNMNPQQRFICQKPMAMVPLSVGSILDKYKGGVGGKDNTSTGW